MASCDDGLSWVGDQSLDPEMNCDGADCDHHPYSAKNTTSAGGWFVTLMGWGNPAIARRTQDGIHWETTLEPSDPARAGVVGDGDHFILLDAYASLVSDDSGGTWQELEYIGVEGNIRVMGFADARVWAFLDGNQILSSANWGQSWEQPESVDCVFNFYNSGMAAGDGVILAVGYDGSGCRSTDGGQSFEGFDTSLDGVEGQVLWTGSEFMAWGYGNVTRSSDGSNWTTTPITLTPGDTFGPSAVAKAPNGSFVAAAGMYSGQFFARSSDGIAWERLDDEAFTQGHPIRNIAHGYVAEASACQP
jgi:hypothetical protein